VAEWKKQMQKAAAAEDYEEAARLRDMIRQAEQ
jgi:protein-arginine kinase activator protein McsA